MDGGSQSFAEYLRAARKKRGLSIRQLAETVGKTPGYLSRIEGRGEIPSPEFICRLAQVLGACVDEMVSRAKRDILRRTESEIQERYEAAVALYRRSK